MNDNLNYWVEYDVLFLQIKGNHSIDDILGLYEKAFTDKSTTLKVSIILDASSSEIEGNKKDTERFVNGLRKYALRITQQAIIIPPDGRFMDMDQAYSYSKSDGYDVQIFKDIDSARAWIEDMPLMGVCGACRPNSE